MNCRVLPKLQKLIWPLVVVILFPFLSQAADRFVDPVQITTNPGEDFAATVSPDGKFLVYVSDRSGNLDLWLKALGPGVHPPDKQLTFHSAKDNSPQFSPDGKWIVFVSNRSDPRGDLYLLDRKEKENDAQPPLRLTAADSAESDPTWSPDSRFIYFISPNPETGDPGLFRWEVQSKSKQPALDLNGVNPAISPDGRFLAYVSNGEDRALWVQDLESNARIPLTSGPGIDVSPRWSRDGNLIYFVRYNDDTNFDGQVTIDDNPNIWSLEFSDSQPGLQRQLTDSSTYDLFPVSSGSRRIFYTSSRGQDIDVWEIPESGLIPEKTGYGASLQLTDDRCSGEAGNSYRCLQVFNNLEWEFAGKKSLVRILYRSARGYQSLGHQESAAKLYRKIIENHADQPIYSGFSKIELLLLNLDRSRQEGVTAYKEKIRESLVQLDEIVSRYKEQAAVVARAYLEMGALNLRLDDPAGALQFYKKVIREYPGQRVTTAAAAFAQNKVYALVGDHESLVQAYVQVVRDYYDVESWTEKAIREILDLFEKHPTLEKKVVSLQALTVKYKNLPRLAGAVQNRIGELYHQANENLLAKEAYRKTAAQFAAASSEKYKALFALAEIYSEEENFEKSLSLYREISDGSHKVKERLEVARAGLIRKTIAKGTWELRVGEVKLALKTFLKLIDFDPATVAAHRGYLQAAAALKKTDQAIGFYRQRLKKSPDSAVDRYALGLAVTYLNPPDLKKAEEEIGKALTLNSQQVYFHQTLGWVYEQKERDNKGEGFLERALHEYQIALALNDAKENPDNEANLLLNLGNGNYLLRNHHAAFRYYQKRDRSDLKFFDRNRESIFRQRYAESAFKSGFPDEAVRQFKKSLKIVSGDKKDLNRLAELNDRLALVYQDKGEHAQAVDYFARALELNRKTGNQVSLSRSLRNIANNLFSLNEQKAAHDPKDLNRALNHYFEAIDNLEKFGVVSKKKEKTALINIDIETGLDPDASAAAMGFDKTGEQKLIFHYIGRIYADFGEYDRAVEYFKKKLALIPDNLDPEKNIPVLLEKALLQNQVGNFLVRSGGLQQSLRYFKDSYQLSRKLRNRRGIAVNAANIGQMVFIQCRHRPLRLLRNEIESTVTLLQEALLEIGPVEEFASPEYVFLIQNLLGIFYHYQGFHMPAPAIAAKGKGSRAWLKAAVANLHKDYATVKKSIGQFEEALSKFRKIGLKNLQIEAALQQNLDLTYQLAGRKGEDGERQAAQPIHLRWQGLYLESLLAPADDRLSYLLEAEKLLARLPYGMVSRDFSSLSLQEDLYNTITRLLFDAERYAEALHFSEKGRQQLLISLRPELRFKNADRRTYHEELMVFASRVRSAADEDSKQAVIEEYQEFLALVGEDDPQLLGLFAADVPPIEEVQSLLREGEVLVKFQKVHDGILFWSVDSESTNGIRLPQNSRLFDVITRLRQNGFAVRGDDIHTLSAALVSPLQGLQASSLYLIADGVLEFLPWAAMRIGDKALAELMPITFLSSFSQLRDAEAGKNLYNSRLLMVEADRLPPASAGFASAENLVAEAANLEGFQSRWRHYGVVNIDSRTHLGGPDSVGTYIGLTRRRNQFHRLRVENLFDDSFESYFIALNDVSLEFHPATGISPTALLLQGLTVRGYPGILLHTGPFDAKVHARFERLFYETFRKGNPAESLRRAQIELAKLFPDSLQWAGYRFYGTPGMEEEERNEFAQEHFMANAQKGAKAFVDKDWLTAIDHFEKALVLMDFLEDKSLTEKIYQTLAQAAYNREDYAKAIRYQQALLPLAEAQEDPEAIAEVLYFLGILESRAENYATAVAHLQQALSIYEEYEILDRLAESYSTLGIVEENALDYDQALQAFSASLKINEEIGEDLNRGRELRRIGRIHYLRLNRYAEARKYFQAAHELFRELDSNEQIVETLLELGLVAEKEGDFKRALEFYGKAQSLAAEDETLQLSLSKAFLYQANSHWFQGNYQQAFRFQKQALELAEAIGDQRQQTFIYNTLGLIYWTLNDSTRALANLEKSLELAREIRSTLDIATAYNNIGLVHRKDKRYEKSIEFFSKALQQDLVLKSKWGQGYTHRNLGMSYLRMARLQEAEPHILQAIELSREIGNRTNLVKAMLERGNLELQRQRCDEAAPVYRETVELAEKLNIAEVHWRALQGIGTCLAKTGQRTEAVAAYKKAVQVVDRMRAAIKVEEFQNGFLTDKQDVYKELILLLLDSGKVQESFQYAERAKSRSFIDLLGNQKISLKNDVGRKIYGALTEQKQIIRTAEEALAAAFSSEREEEAGRLQQELIAARNRYQDLLIQAKEESPEISSFVSVEAITLEDLYRLLDDSVVLVEYLVTAREVVAWVVTKGSIDVVRTPVEEAQLNAVIKDYRNRIQKLAPVEEPSSRLYQWLIAPVEKFLSGKRVVGIVPHGHLHYLSFASLKGRDGYLVERHPLFYSPSASVMRFTFARKFEKKDVVKVLALGNPDLGDFNYNLPLAEMEANAIKWDFPQVDVLTREKATESWLRNHIGDYQIIHIASHGEFDSINPLFSSLKLAKDEEADGSLEVNEVFSLEINADIVTLSACQTGLGEITGGDELVGLNRAFIYAGTHSLLSSLWRVSDISTAILIKHFYRNYARGNKAESLRKAQLLVKKLYPHPSYWAAFSLTGDYR